MSGQIANPASDQVNNLLFVSKLVKITMFIKQLTSCGFNQHLHIATQRVSV